MIAHFAVHCGDQMVLNLKKSELLIPPFLLGQGKSTVFKQLELLAGSRFTEPDREAARSSIIRQLNSVMNYSPTHPDEESDPDRHGSEREEMILFISRIGAGLPKLNQSLVLEYWTEFLTTNLL